MILLLLACASDGVAQWQLGGVAGYGIYRNGSIFAPGGTATAGIRNRFAVGAVLGEDMYDHISGEIRYLYQDGDPFLSSGGRDANIQGQSHAFHYDVLFQARTPEQKVRPYVAAGFGVKLFVVTGPPPVPQPFSRIASLTSNDQARPLVTAGGGVKWRLTDRVVFRADFRDYITPFPKKLLAPAASGTGRGILHQFTPLAGLAYEF